MRFYLNTMWRYLLLFGIGMLLLLSAKADPENAGEKENTKPNVVLIYLDDSGYGDGVQGSDPG